MCTSACSNTFQIHQYIVYDKTTKKKQKANKAHLFRIVVCREQHYLWSRSTVIGAMQYSWMAATKNGVQIIALILVIDDINHVGSPVIKAKNIRMHISPLLPPSLLSLSLFSLFS